MKKSIVFTFFFIFLVTGSAKSQQYGVNVLKLDNFDFNLNIEAFFKDESIFRGYHKDFRVKTVETSGKLNAEPLNFIRYVTEKDDIEKPLAMYAGVPFEFLEIITDEADEKVLMAIGTTLYTTPEQVIKIIDHLILEMKDIPLMLANTYFTNYVFTQENKIVNLYIRVKTRDTYSFHVKEYLDKENYAELINIMSDLESIHCTLFITNTDFDQVLAQSSVYSGELNKYRNW